MGILISRDGRYIGGQLPPGCPLRQATHGAADARGMTLADSASRRLWHNGRVLPCCPGLETLLRWKGFVLTLSGETDCLSLLAPDGRLLVTAPCGMYPQDACIDGHTVYTAGGADGLVHLLSLPELREEGTIAVPGMPQRISVCGTTACVLCLCGSEEVHSLLLRIALPGRTQQVIARLPGVPGAVLTGPGGTWAATTETLLRFPPDSTVPDLCIGGFNLITRMGPAEEGLLLHDGPEERTVLLRLQPAPSLLVFDREER